MEFSLSTLLESLIISFFIILLFSISFGRLVFCGIFDIESHTITTALTAIFVGLVMHIMYMHKPAKQYVPIIVGFAASSLILIIIFYILEKSKNAGGLNK